VASGCYIMSLPHISDLCACGWVCMHAHTQTHISSNKNDHILREVMFYKIQLTVLYLMLVLLYVALMLKFRVTLSSSLVLC